MSERKRERERERESIVLPESPRTLGGPMGRGALPAPLTRRKKRERERERERKKCLLARERKSERLPSGGPPTSDPKQYPGQAGSLPAATRRRQYRQHAPSKPLTSHPCRSTNHQPTPALKPPSGMDAPFGAAHSNHTPRPSRCRAHSETEKLFCYIKMGLVLCIS